MSPSSLATVEPVVCDGARAFRHIDACPAALAAALAGIARRPPPGMVLCKFGSRSVVGRHMLPCGNEVLLKYYYPKNLIKRFTQAVAGSRCMRSWIAALELAEIGLPVPVALFVAEWKMPGGFWLRQSMLATSFAPGVTLPEWVSRHSHDTDRLAGMAARLRGHFSLMARHRVCHGDPKGANILVAEDDSVSFVDLDAVHIGISGKAWHTARARDRRIFAANWPSGSAAAVAFKGVFDDSSAHE